MTAKIHRRIVKLILSLVGALLVLAWVCWRLAPGNPSRLIFDWSRDRGFTTARIDRPSSVTTMQVLAAPFDEVVRIQGKRAVAAALIKANVSRARGRIDLATFGPLPIAWDIDRVSNAGGAYVDRY
jgi:hypothetical protein